MVVFFSILNVDPLSTISHYHLNFADLYVIN